MPQDSRYLSWLVAQLRLEENASTAPCSDRPLVLGYAEGYSVDQVRPFALSLRKHFDGEVSLFVGDDAALRTFLAALDIRSVTGPEEKRRSPHVVVRRFAGFDRLLRTADPASPALLTDVRDVIFQGDPLQPPPAMIEVFDEQNGGVLHDHAFTRKHVRALFGETVARRLDARPALCAGTIAGPAAALSRLCRLILVLCARPRAAIGGAFGADQAALNLAVHLALVEARIIPNFHRIATVGAPETGRLQVREDLMLNPDGTASPVVHQYDRHRHLTDLVDRLWLSGAPRQVHRPRPSLAQSVDRRFQSVRRRIPELR